MKTSNQTMGLLDSNMRPTTKTSPLLAFGVILLALLASNASAFQAGVDTNQYHPALSRKATRLGVRAVDKDSVGNIIQHDRTSQPNSQQANVDDYLEFLERRYKRLNEDEGGQRSDAKFSTWKWLTEGADDDSTKDTQRNANSALHVLGLAGLASEKLLHKYHIAVKRPESTPSINAEAFDAALCAPSVTATVGAMIKPLAFQRKRLLDFQAAKLRTLSSVLLKTLKTAPIKTVQKLVDLSGGKKTVSMTLAVMSVVMFTVVRPLSQSIVSEGAYSA
jgi:hypothetical protein